MRQVRCPWCNRTLFFSGLPWVAVVDERAAIISIRCQRKQSCGRIVWLRFLAVSQTQFEDSGTRTATLQAFQDALSGVAAEEPVPDGDA